MPHIWNKLLFILLVGVFAEAAEEALLMQEDGKKESLEYVEMNGLRISKIESCLKKSCKAYQASERNLKSIELKSPPGGVNPASILCEKIDGIPKVAQRKSGDEVSVCFFSDKSFVFSWDLLNSAFPEK